MKNLVPENNFIEKDKSSIFTVQEWMLIGGLIISKLLLHLLTSTNYELQRDAYLYLAEGRHLAFGYVSVPPLTPWLGRLSGIIFGYSTFAVRLLPAFTGGASVFIIALIVKNLGGRIWAILLAATAFILSVAFLRSNTLFQPVTFNQFFWLLSSYFMIKLLQSKDPKYWLHLQITFGVAFLNKYSVAFLALAFYLSLFLSPQRKLYLSKYFVWGSVAGFLLAVPNLIWQYTHNWPVVTHMVELQRTQLVHVHLPDFLVSQLVMNAHAIFLWGFGLLLILFFKPEKNLRALGYTFVGVILLLIIFRGKHYYSLGIYPALFAAGGVAFERYFVRRLAFLKPLQMAIMILVTIPFIPYSLPVLPLDKMAAYSQATAKHSLEMTLRWEDGKIHKLPQDYADMTGWRELSNIVIDTYHNLPDSAKQLCGIYCGNYGEAGAISYYGRHLNLPEPVSFNDNYLLWAPDSLHNITTLIYVDDDTSDVSHFFEHVQKVGEVDNPYFRENGLPVYLCEGPRNGFGRFYKTTVAKLKQRYRR